MAAKTPFRITPSLGPDLWQAETQFYWDTIGDPRNLGVASYQPGSKVIGNDGHEYVFVKNGGSVLTANARANINETTWVATANGTGTHMGPPTDVPANAWFHARQFTI